MAPMRGFVSWSGEPSRTIARALAALIRRTSDSLNPWMSEQNIDRGSQWFAEISDGLQSAGCGVSVLTPSNLSAPWLLFEAGAILKGSTKTRCYTLLHDLKATDVPPPLGLFQSTRIERDEV